MCVRLVRPSLSATIPRPFPSGPTVEKPVVAAGHFSRNFRPELVIPFKLDRKAAESALAEHYKGKVLLPKSFAGSNRIKEVRGVYVPLWFMDAGRVYVTRAGIRAARRAEYVRLPERGGHELHAGPPERWACPRGPARRGATAGSRPRAGTRSPWWTGTVTPWTHPNGFTSATCARTNGSR